jgi:F-type H+-transporting ATPase subunit gamma
MELIAGTRMRRTERRALEARPYATRLGELVAVLLGDERIRHEHPLLTGRGGTGTLVVQMTTDKGLCGPLNTRLNHRLGEYVLEHAGTTRVATVGLKGREFAVRSGLNLIAEFSNLGDQPRMAALMPLCRLAIGMFTSGAVSSVLLSYPTFVSTLVQHPVFEQLLPVDTSRIRLEFHPEYVIDPNSDALLDALLERYVQAHVYRAYLELVASEYSSRMVAMHNATDSARELGEDLTLELNKLRQAAVTSEISDVSAGVEALANGEYGG